MSRRFANSLKRIKPSLQARIDWSHPAAQGLIMACPFNELAGPVRNLCTWQQADSYTGTAPVWTGSHLQFSGGHASFGDVTWFDGLAAFTIMLRARPANLTQTAGLLNKRNSFSENTDVCVTLANPNTLTCITGGVAPSLCNYGFDVSGWVGFETVFITFDSAASANNRWKCWRGVTALTPTVAADVATAVPATTYPLVIGAINTASPLYVAAGIDYIYAWAGAQPLSVRDAILDDAFCFLADGPRRVYFVPTAEAVIHEAAARIQSFSAARANATVLRAAQLRSQGVSSLSASSSIIRAAQARAQGQAQVFALPHVVRGASVRCQSGASIAARLIALRQMQARVQGQSAMLVAEARRPGLKLTIGDVVKVKLVIGDELAEG